MRRLLLTIDVVALLLPLTIRADSLDAALLDATRTGNFIQVQELIDKGVPVETSTADGITSLMIAAAQGDLTLTRLLVERGAQLNARGPIGNTPLIYAVQEGHTEIARFLVEQGAQVDLANEYGTTARKLAIGWGHRDIVPLVTEEPNQEWFSLTKTVPPVIFFLGLAAVVGVIRISFTGLHGASVR